MIPSDLPPLGSPAYYQNPYPTLSWMREHHPVHYHDDWNVWVLTRHDHVTAVLRDTALFSNAGRFATFLNALPPEAEPYAEPIRRHYSSGLLQSDPPDHTRLRPLVSKAFTPRVVSDSAERFRSLVERLVDEQLSGSPRPESFDVVSGLAYPLPATVISDLLGVPEAHRALLIEWSDKVVEIQRAGRAVLDDHIIATAEGVLALEQYFEGLAADAARRLESDLLAGLAARADGDQLSDDELVSTLTTLMIAGHETTRNLIGNGMLLLLQHPDALAQIKERPELLESAIEEMLRLEPPVQRAWRRISADTDRFGVPMREGQLVYLMVGAANRDPQVFDRPDSFIVDRGSSRHLAFGFGVHFCVGAALARLEARVAFEALIDRFPNPLLTETPRWHESLTHRGLHQLLIATSSR